MTGIQQNDCVCVFVSRPDQHRHRGSAQQLETRETEEKGRTQGEGEDTGRRGDTEKEKRKKGGQPYREVGEGGDRGEEQ